MADGQTQTQQAAEANGMHVTCTNTEYHARPEWSSTQLKCLGQDGPLMFRRRYITGESRQRSKKAFDLGTVVHAALLEPTGLMGIAEEIPRDVLSKSGSRAGAAWDEFKAARPGKILLSPGEVVECKTMVDRVMGHKAAAELLREPDSDSEFSIAWHDAGCGLDLRCRLDRFIRRPRRRCVLLDVKTTRRTQDKFRYDISDYQYLHQAAHYWEGAIAFGWLPEKWVFVVVQNCEPYDAWAYEVTDDHPSLEQARAERSGTLRDLARRLNEDDWQPETYGLAVPLPELPGAQKAVTLTINGKPLDL